MAQFKSYSDNPYRETVVNEIVAGIDRDVERSEDILMLGLATGMFSSLLAPIAPPHVLLPLVALAFALSAGFARINYQNMQKRLSASIIQLNYQQRTLLSPIARVFADFPMEPLEDSLNPLKNVKRTWKSVLGGIIMNPFWIPIFYMLGMQIGEEKNVYELNRAIIGVEQKIKPTTIALEESDA
jgi:hypothetical protein